MALCKQCGKAFLKSAKQQRYCSKKCRIKAGHQLAHQRRPRIEVEPTRLWTFYIDEQARREQRLRLARQGKRLSEVE